MKPPPARSLLAGLLTMGLLMTNLTACSRLAAPEPGDYRAVLNLKGGELPLVLNVAPAADPAGSITLSLAAGDQTFTTSQVTIQDGKLTAQWPDLGTLSGEFSAQDIHGELRITGADGKPVALPLMARRGQAYRFVEKSSSDNADISGSWKLEALSADHFNVPVLMQLHQRHDQVDGSIQLPDGMVVGVIGQTQGDSVSLGLLGHGRAVLLKGRVNERGELQGEFWVNLGSAHSWIALRDQTAASTEVADRQVGMPWAVPVRDIMPTSASASAN